MSGWIFNEKQREILDELKRRMTKDGLQILEDIPESENDPRFVSVLFEEVGIARTEVMGQVFFYDENEYEPDVLNAGIVYTLADSLNREDPLLMKYAVNHANTSLPMGKFCLNEDGSVLTYRHSFGISAEEPMEQAPDMIVLHLNLGMEYVITWIDAFLGLHGGIFSLEEFLKF